MGLGKKLKSIKKEDWINVVQAVAPTIATALGGPLAGVGVAALSRAILGKENGTEDELAAVIGGADPETLLKLKTAELEFESEMKRLEISEDALVYADKDSARAREMAVKDKTPSILAGVVISGFLVYVGAVTFVPDLPVDKDILMFVLGQTSALAGTAISYYLGSSRGSKDKNTILDRVINGTK